MRIFSVSSSAFYGQEMIPKRYTCDGENVSPPLEIINAPKETKSFAMIMDDPDAPIGTFTHWVVWNIPRHKNKINEGEDPGKNHGRNDFGEYDYKGPCPPPGKPHKYFFRVYALDLELDIPENSTRKELEREMDGHILDETSLIAKYGRE